MRITLALIAFFSITSNTMGQKLSRKFEGRVEYAIEHFTVFLTFDSCGDYQDSRFLMRHGDTLLVNDVSVYEDENARYTPFKFERGRKAIKLIYWDPDLVRNDTIEQFPLQKGDTIMSSEDYLLTVNSQGSLKGSSNYFSSTTNIGDTTIAILNHKYQCYRFEKFHYNRKSNPGPSHSRLIIFIDKKSLLPVQEELYRWYRHHRCLPSQKWFLTRRVKMVKIESDR